MKRLLIVMMIVAGMAAIAATPTVSNVTAKQRFPWNGLVDINCTVSGIDGVTNGCYFALVAMMPDSGKVRNASHFWIVQSWTNSNDREVCVNGDYRLLWDARGDLGQMVCSNMILRVMIVKATHNSVQLWEDGPYWAEMNVGSKEPWEYGYYFWWGDTVGYKCENDKWVASDGSSSNFSFSESNTPTCNKSIVSLLSEGWITADGILAPEHDAAQVQWGGVWRMPTRQELDNLSSKCDLIWTTTNGVTGCIVRGRGNYASNSIFLPAAGVAYEVDLRNDGYYCLYWSSVPYSDSYYDSSLIKIEATWRYTLKVDRSSGFPIRPVLGSIATTGHEAAVCHSEDSAPFRLDTMEGTRMSDGSEALSYSSMWNGNANATVTVSHNGVILVSGLTGEGDYVWQATHVGTNVVTHTTYTNDVAGHVETATFVVGPELTFDYDGGPSVGVMVIISGNIDGWTVYYTTDGSTPTVESAEYTEPFILASAATIKAFAVSRTQLMTRIFEREYNVEKLPRVENVRAKQRYPWNGLVDITCNVSGISGTTNGLKFAVEAVIPNSDNVRNVLNFWVVQSGTNSIDREVHANGDYRLVWDAPAELGAVIYSNMVVRVTLKAFKVQLWAGGPYWATTNIGAEEPWENGYYFWWGDTVGYKYENDSWVASDNSSGTFEFDPNSGPTYRKSIETLKSEGWITTGSVLAPEHDVAQVQWGGGWRMPTGNELSELLDYCNWTWTTMNGISGYLIRGRGDYASASIFLPAAGFGWCDVRVNAGSNGKVWSSTPRPSNNYDARALYFDSGTHGMGFSARNYGFPVRPVQK